MAFCEFKNVRIAGIAAGVPQTVFDNRELSAERGEISREYTAEAFIEATGVAERRVSEKLCTSDLCFAAAQRLLGELGWERESVDAVIFVSQTADYIEPATACILQERLGLGKETYAADVALGCSGWVYGLSYAAALAQTGTIKRVLLCAGDAKKRCVRPLNPLFGYAGTCTAVEYSTGGGGVSFPLWHGRRGIRCNHHTGRGEPQSGVAKIVRVRGGRWQGIVQVGDEDEGDGRVRVRNNDRAEIGEETR